MREVRAACVGLVQLTLRRHTVLLDELAFQLETFGTEAMLQSTNTDTDDYVRRGGTIVRDLWLKHYPTL